MKITVEIDLEDLKALYNGYKLNIYRNGGMSVQDYDMQVKEREQEERIDTLIKPLIMLKVYEQR